MPDVTQKKLFPGAGLKPRNYLELCRFFVYDWCPKNTATRFLAFTHRVLKKNLPDLKFLYTYAAGFQGMVGYIYQASGYTYIGKTQVSSFILVPDVGLVHAVSLWHRYKRGSAASLAMWQGIFPGAKQWLGHNFCYILPTCRRQEWTELMRHASFSPKPYPKDKDLRIWTVDKDGGIDYIDPRDARKVPIVKLTTRRKHRGDATGSQPGEGGSNPTPTLQPPSSKVSDHGRTR